MATIVESRQRTSALTKANDTRTGRRILKAKLAALSQAEGRKLAAEIIREPPDYLSSMMVWDLLSAIRHVGPTKVKQTMRRADPNQPFDPWVRFQDLSPRRRAILAAEVECRA